MKRNNLYGIPLFFVLLSILASCSDDEQVTNPNEKKYGGQVDFLANGTITSLSENSVYFAQGHFELTSKFGKDTQLSISINPGFAQKTYAIDNDSTSMVYFNDEKPNKNFYIADQDVSEVVITKIDEVAKTISGTFKARLENQDGAAVTIANGVFTDVPYVIQEEGEDKDKIATVDGTDFLATIFMYGSSGSNVNFAYAGKYKIIEFSLPGEIEAGTYDVTDLEAPWSYISYVEGMYTYQAVSGTYTITKHDASIIEGTYELNFESHPLKDKKRVVKNGVFSVPFSN